MHYVRAGLQYTLIENDFINFQCRYAPHTNDLFMLRSASSSGLLIVAAWNMVGRMVSSNLTTHPAV